MTITRLFKGFALAEAISWGLLLKDAATGEALLVDAADDAAAIREVLAEAHVENEALVGVVTTHKHWDHHRALPEIAPLARRAMPL